MRGLVFPRFAKITSGEPVIEAHSRGHKGDGGHYAFGVGGGARLVWNMTVAPMCTVDALKFRAFLHGLRGPGGTFALALPGATLPDEWLNTYTDGTYFTDGTRYRHAAPIDLPPADTTALIAEPANSNQLLVGDATLAAGTWIAVLGTDVQIVRVWSAAPGTTRSATTGNNIGVRPRIRAAVTAGTGIAVLQAYGYFRLRGNPPAVPLINGRSLPVVLDLEEVY